MPLHLASLWATKRFELGGGRGLILGPGIRYTGHSFDGMDLLPTPAYTLFDATAAFQTLKWRIAVNAANLGDKVHLTACLARGDCLFGMRRTVILTLSRLF
jgi:iron complex outermembrane receptor protein